MVDANVATAGNVVERPCVLGGVNWMRRNLWMPDPSFWVMASVFIMVIMAIGSVTARLAFGPDSPFDFTRFELMVLAHLVFLDVGVIAYFTAKAPRIPMYFGFLAMLDFVFNMIGEPHNLIVPGAMMLASVVVLQLIDGKIGLTVEEGVNPLGS